MGFNFDLVVGWFEMIIFQKIMFILDVYLQALLILIGKGELGKKETLTLLAMEIRAQNVDMRTVQGKICPDPCSIGLISIGKYQGQ